MLDTMTFHHIGIAVKSIDMTSAIYVSGGYLQSKIIFDPEQNVNICWLIKKGMPLLELLEPVGDDSPVNALLKKNGVIPYHICYMVENIELAIAELQKMKYVTICKPVEAVAINGSKVSFLYNKNIGLIELVEAPANIIQQ